MSDNDVPDFVAVRDHVRDELVRFTRALRRAGAYVPANASMTGARALVQIGFTERERVRSALQACFITEQSDLQTFDDLFPEFWRRLTAGFDSTGPASRHDVDGDLAHPGDQTQSRDAGERNDRSDGDDGTTDDVNDIVEAFETSIRSADIDDGSEDNESVTTSLYSPTGQRTGVSTPAIGSGNGFENAFRELSSALGGIPSRRWQSGGDERTDVRRALRESIGTGGTVLTVPRRERKRTAVRCHLLVDVSRSVIDVIDRSFLVRFLSRARADWHSRVFFFDDRLREVTEAFTASSPRSAIDALERAETEWGGGTRIGGSIERLRTTAPNAIDRRTIVLIISDGLEMGDVSDLERELSKLSRRAKSVLWLNPLATSDAYEPTAGGMAAALPFIDGLFAFAGPSDIAEIARQLHRGTENVGYEFDIRLRGN